MCVVSFVGDYYLDKWRYTPPLTPNVPVTTQTFQFLTPPVTREEFDGLKREVLEMKDLLKRAKIYDEQTGQPDCEMDEKMDVLRKVAKLVGVELDDVLGKPA